MNKKKYLIFDMGSSHGRASVGAYNGSEIKINQIYEFENRPVLLMDILYWDLKRLYQKMKSGIRLALGKNNIRSIGISTWGVDFSFIDRKMRLLNDPIHYRDKGRFTYAEGLFDIVGKKELYMTLGGCLKPPISSIFNLFFLKKIGAYELNEAHKFLLIPDLFNFFLTGETVGEFSEAGTTFLYNIKEKKWEKGLLDKLNIPLEIFPEVIQPGRVIGKTRTKLMQELEIPQTRVVAPVTHDTCSAVAGIPIKDDKENWAFISMGTWCTMGIETKSFLLKEEAIETGFYYEGGTEGKNLFVVNITGLWIIQQCREIWNNEPGKNLSWPKIEELSSDAGGFESFINVDNDLFSKTNPNMNEAIIDYCAKYKMPAPRNIGDISRAIYESLALRIRYHREILERLMGIKLQRFYVIGGGAKSALLCQSISSANGIPLCAISGEATSYGNFIMQLMADREIKDLGQGRQLRANSSVLRCFEPMATRKWDEYYGKYLDFLEFESRRV